VRRPKPPLAAWLIRKRKEREWKPGDIASRLDVAEVTVRGWESGRNIRAESIESLERLFGEEAPGRGDAEGGAGSAATSELVAALRDQTAALRDLVDALRDEHGQAHRERGAILDAIGALARGRLTLEGTAAENGPRPPAELVP
jgi:transcriptional regulator with XRE-family HTH domain